MAQGTCSLDHDPDAIFLKDSLFVAAIPIRQPRIKYEIVRGGLNVLTTNHTSW